MIFAWFRLAQTMLTMVGEVAQREKQDKYLACHRSAVFTNQF